MAHLKLMQTDSIFEMGLKGFFRRLRRQAFNIRNNDTCGIWGTRAGGERRKKQGQKCSMKRDSGRVGCYQIRI